jgi:beta-lactam-binding protein with PASTA domain
VVGLSEEEATAALEAKGLVVSIDHVLTLDQNVLGQDPAAGERVRKGDEVVIQVSFF